MYCCAAKLGEPVPKIFSGAQVLEGVVVGPLTGVPAGATHGIHVIV
jgi:hypothetical protein